MAHGNICGVIIERCEFDLNDGVVYALSGLICLLTILQIVYVQSDLGVLGNPLYDGIKTFKKLILYR